MGNEMSIDPKLDLVMERTTDVAAEKIWQGWTDPKTLMEWFCPRPWKVTDCRIQLKPGGEFYTVMEGPKGEKMHNHGCYLEVVPKRKLVWTGMMTKGFRPVVNDTLGFAFVATIEVQSSPKGTLFKATVAHADEEGRKKHEQMGFHEGWGKAFDQLVELMKK